MLLLWAHDFVSGGLAYCFGDCGSRYTVLGCSYPVRNALARHLRLPRCDNKTAMFDVLATLAPDASYSNSCPTGYKLKAGGKKRHFIRNCAGQPPFSFKSPPLTLTDKTKTKLRRGVTTAEGRPKRHGEVTATTMMSMIITNNVGSPPSGETQISGMPWSRGPLADSSERGRLSSSHPDVAHRISASSSSSSPSCYCCCCCSSSSTRRCPAVGLYLLTVGGNKEQRTPDGLWQADPSGKWRACPAASTNTHRRRWIRCGSRRNRRQEAWMRGGWSLEWWSSSSLPTLLPMPFVLSLYLHCCHVQLFFSAYE